jgi:Sigma-70, region 4
MRKIRDVLRLKFERGLSERVIARSMSLSNGSVNSYLQRARMAGLRWPLPDDLADGALERLLFPPAATAETARARARPGWAEPKAWINVAVGDASAAHDRVERALMIAWNGCSASVECAPEAWATLNSGISRPFDKPKNGRIAVKVINHLGDEVMKVFKVTQWSRRSPSPLTGRK